MKEKTKRNRFPGVLWLLPILFGPLGGVIGAVLAGTVYQSSWWELLVVGFCMCIVYLAAIYALGMAIF